MPSEFYLLQPDGTPKFFPGEGTGAQGDPLVPFHKPHSKECLSYAGDQIPLGQTLISGESGVIIRVLAILISADTTCVVKLQSNGADVYPRVHLAGDRNHSLACNTGLFESEVGESIDLVYASGSGPVSVFLRYEKI